MARLRDMVKDKLLERMDFGGNPPHIEYALTERGRVLLPLVEALRVWAKLWTVINVKIARSIWDFTAKLARKCFLTSEPEALSTTGVRYRDGGNGTISFCFKCSKQDGENERVAKQAEQGARRPAFSIPSRVQWKVFATSDHAEIQRTRSFAKADIRVCIRASHHSVCYEITR